MNAQRRALASVSAIAALDCPQPDELPLLAQVRIELTGGRTVEGTVVARTHETIRRYDILTPQGRIYPDEYRASLTVLGLPDAGELERVIR